MAFTLIRLDRWLGLILALAAGVVYWLTLSIGAFPGESAQLIVQYSRIGGLDTTSYPLWSFCLKALAALPWGDLALRLNLFSLLCGIVTVGLLYRLVSHAVRALIAEEDVHPEPRARVAAILAGTAASLALAFAIPFWVVSNRAHHASFDVLLLLVAAFLLQRYAQRRRFATAVAFALFYGLATVEFATFSVMAPIFGIYLLVLLWRAEQLNARRVAVLILAALAGLALYLFAAWRFMLTPAYEIGDFIGYWQVVWASLRAQYALIAQSLPQIGWLLVLLVSAVPWLAALLVCRRALNDERDWGFYLLHVLITGVIVAVMVNAPIAPWALLGFRHMLVTPYLLIAITFGYLTAYWYLLPAAWWQFSEEPGHARARRILSGAAATALLVFPVVCAVLNWPAADARPAGIVNAYARDAIADLGGRPWLVTDSAWENNLLVAAHDAGRPLRTLNIGLGNKDIYMRYVAAQFDNPRLKSMTQVSMLAFLQEWMASDPNIIREVGIATAPDLWAAAGIAVLPQRTLYLGYATNAAPDPARLWADHEAYWARTVPELQRAQRRGGISAELATGVLRALSMEANNLGVLLEDLGQKEQAYKAYSQARLIYTNNVSALLNQYALFKRGFEAGDRVAVESALGALESRIRDRNQKIRIWSLARYYGYVRMPEAFADMGWTWAMSGQPGLAVSGLKRAISLGLAETDAARFQQALADIYLMLAQVGESAKIYGDILARDPENAAALIGLAKVKARQGDFTLAEELLARAEKVGVPREKMALEWAALYLMAGKADRARIVLQELIDLNPEHAAAWTLLGMVMLNQGDDKGVEECLHHLEKGRGKDFALLTLQGQVAMRRKDLDAARRAYDQALALQPNNVMLLERLLQLDALTGRPDLADVHVSRLLSIDPGNASGNYFLGSLQIRRRQLALAENSMRKSLQRTRSIMALNDLAWILQERENYGEAEQLAREALQKEPAFGSAWDTLGVILMKTGRNAESEEALEKAIKLNPDALGTIIHLAQMQVRKSAFDKAAKLIVTLQDRLSELSKEDREELDRLRQALKK
jgi:tetratricopeptide (TPR) repeat protein